jgi:hypothetical protein
VAAYLEISASVVQQRLPLSHALLLIRAIVASTWLQSTGRLEIQGVVTSLHVYLAPDVMTSFKDNQNISDA